MSRRCLSEVALMRMHAGLGTDAQRAHVMGCERCTAGYRKLIGDLEIVTGVVMDAPVAPVLRARPRPAWRWRRLTVASAIAAAMILAAMVRVPVWPSASDRPPAAPAAPAPRGAMLSTDPDTLIGSPPSVDAGCAAADDEVVTVACQDDEGAGVDADVGTDVG